MYTGVGEAPLTTIPSNPALFRLNPQVPPTSLSAQMPVKGDSNAMECRPDVGMGVPVNGPAIKIRGFFAESSGVCARVSLTMIHAARPLPPVNLLYVFSSKDRTSNCPLLKSTQSILPV